MKSFFKEKEYGTINHYLIVCQAVKTIPGFEKFSSVPRPIFKETQWFRKLDGTKEQLLGVYSYGVKFDFEEYDQFVAASDEEAERMIAQKVIDSLSNLDRLSKKAAGFDKERFKSDLIWLFSQHKLI